MKSVRQTLLFSALFASQLGIYCLNGDGATRAQPLPTGAEQEMPAKVETNNPTRSPVEISLKDMRDAAHRMRQAALDLINEVEQRSMVVVGQPMIIQPTPVMDPQNKPVGWAEQAIDLGPALPPRKKWLEATMAHLGKAIDILQSDFDNMAVPAEKQSTVQPHWETMQGILQDIQVRYGTLKDLTRGPKYDNIAIGKQALAIYDGIAKFEKPWKKVIHIVRQKT